MDECVIKGRNNAMKISGILDEDFVNYKKPCMFISTSTCSFKCETESGVRCCQNSDLATSPKIDVTIDSIITRYLNNPITSAICFGGLEPMDQFNDIVDFIHYLRYKQKCQDDVVIYTGYNKNEIQNKVEEIAASYSNIIFKFGRYVPGQNPHFDQVLGVNLASDNQYGEVVS